MLFPAERLVPRMKYHVGLASRVKRMDGYAVKRRREPCSQGERAELREKGAAKEASADQDAWAMARWAGYQSYTHPYHQSTASSRREKCEPSHCEAAGSRAELLQLARNGIDGRTNGRSTCPRGFRVVWCRVVQ